MHARQHLVAAQQDRFLVGRHASGLQQRQVDFPLFQAMADVLGTAFEHGHGNARVQLAEGVHQPRYIVQAEHGRDAQAHFAALQVGHVAQLLPGHIHFAQGRFDTWQEAFALGCQDDFARGAVEQGDAQFFFQAGNGHAQCRLGNMQVLRGFGEAALAHDLDAAAQCLEVH
ncbi:hypothetical protein D3C71_1406140 [compost metagenome]